MQCICTDTKSPCKVYLFQQKKEENNPINRKQIYLSEAIIRHCFALSIVVLVTEYLVITYW